MNIDFSKEQIHAALQWIANCATSKWQDGCVIKDPQMMHHHEFPEFLFLKFTKLQSTEDSGIIRTTNYTIVDRDGNTQSMSDKWGDRMVRMGIIADLMAFRLKNGKIELV
jgi:hypothetical protein|tara:strand:- start:243 stop:572 length:330 start_codon:yes stop_codon:yes gene_type:complete